MAVIRRDREMTDLQHKIALFIINNPGVQSLYVAHTLGVSAKTVLSVRKKLNIPRYSKPEDCVG